MSDSTSGTASDAVSEQATHETAPAQPQRSLWVTLSALMIAVMLAMLDNMVIGTAMPTIVGELGGLDHLAWVVTAYALATAASTPLWGKLGDMYGRKGTFLLAIVIFLVGSATSGAAQTMGQLIGFRALQGLGAGGLLVGAMAIMADLVSPRERGKYMGMMAGVMSFAMIGGPLVGGALTDHLGWRWAFYINLPLGIVALVMVGTVLHLPKKQAEGRIDYVGAALLITAITSAVLLTSWGGTEYAWGSGVIIGLGVLAVAALAGFLVVERRVAEPILPLEIFRIRNFTLAIVIGFLVGFAMFGAMTFLPLFQQAVQGASATNSGLLLLPMLLPLMFVSVVVGRATTATGRYRIYPIIGGALIPLGLFLLSRMDSGTGRLTSALYMAVLGLGLGFVMQLSMLIVQNSVALSDMGVASSAATLFRTIGGSFGVALMGTLFARRVQDGMAEGPAGGSEQVANANGQLDKASLDKLPEAAREAYEQAVANGTQSVFLLGAVLTVIIFLVALAVKEVPLRDSAPSDTGGADAGAADTGTPTDGAAVEGPHAGERVTVKV